MLLIALLVVILLLGLAFHKKYSSVRVCRAVVVVVQFVYLSAERFNKLTRHTKWKE